MYYKTLFIYLVAHPLLLCLQGRIPYKVLQIRSTFDDYMEVTQVTFQPPDLRFYYVPQNGNTVLLQPHEQNIVSHIAVFISFNCLSLFLHIVPIFSRKVEFLFFIFLSSILSFSLSLLYSLSLTPCSLP